MHSDAVLDVSHDATTVPTTHAQRHVFGSLWGQAWRRYRHLRPLPQPEQRVTVYSAFILLKHVSLGFSIEVLGAARTAVLLVSSCFLKIFWSALLERTEVCSWKQQISGILRSHLALVVSMGDGLSTYQKFFIGLFLTAPLQTIGIGKGNSVVGIIMATEHIVHFMYDIPFTFLFSWYLMQSLSANYETRMWGRMLGRGFMALKLTAYAATMILRFARTPFFEFLGPLATLTFLYFLALYRNRSHIARGSSLSWLHLQGRRKQQWRKYIRVAKIKWVRGGTIRRWSRQHRCFCRSQQLQPDEFVVGGEQLGRIVVSHPWLSPHHPDPHGHQLRMLVEQFDSLGIKDNELVFYDFCSLPQRPRSISDDKDFRYALSKMHLIYTLGFAKVVVIPWVPEGADNVRPYADRGWCFFEIGISADYGRIANCNSPQVVRLLETLQCPMQLDDFARELDAKTFTGKADRECVKGLYADMVREQRIDTAICSLVWAIVVLGCIWGYLSVKSGYEFITPAIIGLLTIVGADCAMLAVLHPFSDLPEDASLSSFVAALSQTGRAYYDGLGLVLGDISEMCKSSPGIVYECFADFAQKVSIVLAVEDSGGGTVPEGLNKHDYGKYTWSQDNEEVVIRIALDSGAISRKDVNVIFRTTTLKVSVQGQTMLEGTFCGKVEPDSSTWCFSPAKDEIQIMLVKMEGKIDPWEGLFV